MDIPVNPTALLVVLGTVFVGVPLLVYGGLPLLIKFTYRQPARYRLPPEPMDRLLVEGGPVFRALDDQLKLLGFRLVAASSLGVENRLGVYRSSIDTCFVTLAVISGTVTVDFTQPYADGFNLSLTNAPFPSVFPTWERKTVYRLPGESDLGRLYQVFKAIRSREKRTPKAITPGFELTDIEAFCNDEVQHLIRRGFLSARNPERLTLKGAYAMTLPLLPPFKGLLLSAEKARTMRAEWSGGGRPF
ncbi:MAG: hypothetical protein NZ585_05965 [Chloracidobacterium sp.]|nr:hypothetical protein [Chloracidobacterium sp.]MDW8216151.1 hypothetical protein [Acidobacteriota bacterium]